MSKKEGVEPTAAAIHIRSVFTVVLQDAVTPGMNQAIKSADELYRFWHNFENLPRFMKHLKNVEVYDEKKSHWIANAPWGQSVEWDAYILEDRENEFISWASAEGSDVDNSGFVCFTKAPSDRGTEVKVVMEYNPPGGHWEQRSLNFLVKNQNSKLAMNYIEGQTVLLEAIHKRWYITKHENYYPSCLLPPT